MKEGVTFLAEIDRHLWLILSDPVKDDQRIVIVSITSLEPHKDQACILKSGAHPWITHDSCVAYDFGRIVRLADLLALKDAGRIRMQEPLEPHVLKTIRERAADSTTFPMGCADVLIEQGLLEC